MARTTVQRHRDAEALSGLLGSPEVAQLISNLVATRWTGRPGYPIRAMVGMCLVKALNAIPTWTRTVALVADHSGLRTVLGCAPSLDACYRFTVKLRQNGDRLAECLDAVLASLSDHHPEMGEQIAIDGSDLPAYANGRGDQADRSDPDAAWGRRSGVGNRPAGTFYGYKVHAVVDVATELPVAWRVTPGNGSEYPEVPGLLDEMLRRGFVPTFAIMDKGYDSEAVHGACHERGMKPIIPLRADSNAKAGADSPHKCGHGTWVFAGSDMKRNAAKWRCPTGACLPTASMWVPASRLRPLVPRTTERWRKLYAQRGCVERGFGRLKHEWGLLPLRVRRIDRVKLHIDLTILAQLATALAKARSATVPLAA